MNNFPKILSGKYIIVCSGIIFLLYSCNTSNNVVSSFGKRKYTKGYYFNSPATNIKLARFPKEQSNNNSTKIAHIDSVIPNPITNRVSQLKIETLDKFKVLPADSLKDQTPIKVLINLTDVKDIHANNRGHSETPGNTSMGENETEDDYRCDNKAIIGLVFGIISLPLCLLFVFSILGIVFSSMGLNSKNKRPLAIIGLILSIIGLIIGIIILADLLAIVIFFAFIF